MNYSILAKCVDSNWKKPLLFLANTSGTLHSSTIRSFLGIDLNHLTHHVADYSLTLDLVQKKQFKEDFKNLLQKKWRVKNADNYQRAFENTFYNQEFTINKLPSELLFHIATFLNIKDLAQARTCKKLAGIFSSQPLLNHFFLEKLILQPSTTFKDIGKFIDEYGTLIKTLDFKFFQNQLTNQQLYYIIQKCPYLISLNLDHQSTLTDTGLKYLKSLSYLQHLSLAGCEQLSGKGLKSLRVLPHLISLNLATCIQITDDDLGDIKLLIHLEILNLARCRQITDAGLKHLQALENLKSLSLASCHLITDVGIKYLKNLIHLLSLSLAICDHITDRVIEDLNCFCHLEQLNVRRCRHITQVGKAHLNQTIKLVSSSINITIGENTNR